jgi:7-cyano-7-deazaguanine reductase
MSLNLRSFLVNKYEASQSELGRDVHYDQSYNPKRLYPIARVDNRNKIGIVSSYLPFHGYDYWNHYEVSWLNNKGKPIVAMAEIIYDCSSPMIVESKSLKMYFNSLNNSKFSSVANVEETIQSDLEEAIQSRVFVKLKQLGHTGAAQLQEKLEGDCLDDIDIECTTYTITPDFLSATDEVVEESLYSDLLKANCLVTNQPDWGSVQIAYKGRKMNRAGLLQYIVSFRNNNEFAEQCIERIFIDIFNYCKPVSLAVYGRFTRRGGIDINPFRATKNMAMEINNIRLIRQ